jgi:tetratricopeptide (TPR) repeat protein
MRNIEDCIKKGNELFEKKRFSEFIFFCKKITKENIPIHKKAEIWYRISLAFYALESYPSAIRSINKAIILNPDNPVYWIHKGNLLQSERCGHWDEAIEAYKTANRLRPDDYDTLIKLGLLYESRNNPKKAIEMYQKALELNPANPEIWYNMGVSLNSVLFKREKQKRLLTLTSDIASEIQFLNEIINTFKKVLELDPKHSDALYSIGVLYTKMMRYSDALKYFDEALKYYAKGDEKPIQIWYSKAEVLEKVGRTKEASELYQRYENELKKDFEEFFSHHRFGYRI